jgi:very-short-patch-repair endonuclease
VDTGESTSILRRVAPSRVLTVFTPHPTSTRRSLVESAETLSPSPTLVTVHWQTAPALDHEINHLLSAIAEAARSLWPQWYATVDERFDRERWPTTERELRLTEASHLVRGLSPAWFRKAWSACRRGRLPLVRGMSSAEQLRQLALALDPSGPIVLLAVSSPEATPTRIHTLARAADWLATQAACALLLLVPDAWAASPELDPVNYDAVQVTADDEPTDETPLPPDQPRVVVEPPVGRPHPGSEPEQRLYERLTRDAELTGLFQCNRRVHGFRECSYRVDLLWTDGRLVVELDGDDHRARKKYYADRDRDYRLLLAGYTVLRVTNHDVLTDVALVVEKIRNVVHLGRHAHKEPA